MRCSTLPVLGLLLSVSVQAGATGTAPNVIHIYVDDMRADFMSNAGHAYLATPNLDRLAGEGVKYTNAYIATSLCGPSRGTLMTGRLPSQHDIRNHENVYTHDYTGVEFLPELIKDAGASNAIIGKWHHGDRNALLPSYDHYFLNNGVVDPNKREEQIYFNRFYSDNGTVTAIEKYNTDVMFDEITDFVSEQAGSSTPYNAYVSVFSPHWPYDPAPRHLNQYDGLGVPNRPNLDTAALPPYLSDIDSLYERSAEMILAIDEGIGRLFTALEDAGTLDQTVIIFSSDNGFLFGEHGYFDKAQPWQESINVPLLVRWGDQIAGGQTSDALVSQADIAVTIADLMGADVPNDTYGQSLAGVWSSGGVDSGRGDVVSMQYPPRGDLSVPTWATLITDDGWKYVAVPDADTLDLTQFGWFLHDLEPMLFDLNADPYELNNLAGQATYAAIEDELKARLAAVLAENSAETAWIGAPVPEPGTGAVCLLSLALVSMRRRRSA